VGQPKPPGRRGRTTGGEDAALARLAAAHLAREGPPPDGELWIGDDAALVRFGPSAVLLSTDVVVGGVHADLSLVTPEDLGWKAVAAAVSDIGAMGGRPRHLLVTCCLPPDADVDRIDDGVGEAAAAFGVAVVGGDLSVADEIVVAVAVTGTVEGDGPPVSRSGARPGDHLFVTGPLGASAAGLRVLRERRELSPDEERLAEAHRRPRPRLSEGQVARRAGASAMIDVSDGLAIDLDRLATASGVGLDLDDVPVADGATLDEALGGGEDYELVVATARPDELVTALKDAGLRPPYVLGRCTARPGERLLRGRPLERLGWEHPIGGSSKEAR